MGSRNRYVATDDDTFSVTSSVFNYQYENGRRYHAFREGKGSPLDVLHELIVDRYRDVLRTER